MTQTTNPLTISDTNCVLLFVLDGTDKVFVERRKDNDNFVTFPEISAPDTAEFLRKLKLYANILDFSLETLDFLSWSARFYESGSCAPETVALVSVAAGDTSSFFPINDVLNGNFNLDDDYVYMLRLALRYLMLKP